MAGLGKWTGKKDSKKKETVSREYKVNGVLKVKCLTDRAAQTYICNSMKAGREEENPER